MYHTCTTHTHRLLYDIINIDHCINNYYIETEILRTCGVRIRGTRGVTSSQFFESKLN